MAKCGDVNLGILQNSGKTMKNMALMIILTMERESLMMVKVFFKRIVIMILSGLMMILVWKKKNQKIYKRVRGKWMKILSILRGLNRLRRHKRIRLFMSKSCQMDLGSR